MYFRPDEGLGMVCPLGGRLLILGKVTRHGRPANTEVLLQTLKDSKSVDICTEYSHRALDFDDWPRTLPPYEARTTAGGLYNIRFNFDDRRVPPYAQIRIIRWIAGDVEVTIRVPLRRVSVDSVEGVLIALGVSPIDAFLDHLSEYERALRASAVRPLPIWCALVNADIGTGHLVRCVAQAPCALVESDQ